MEEKQGREQPTASPLRTTIIVLVVAVGVIWGGYLLWTATGELMVQRKIIGFNRANARVEKTNVERQETPEDEVTYVPVVEFSYEVAEQRETGRHRFERAASTDPAEAEAFLKPYKPGRRLAIAYDPNRPGRVRMRRLPSLLANIMKGVLGTALLLLVAGIAWRLLRTGLRTQREPVEIPEQGQEDNQQE